MLELRAPRGAGAGAGAGAGVKTGCVQPRRVGGAALDALTGDDLLLFLLQDARPLLGVAGLVDWRLLGRLSQALATGTLTAAAGERALWPAPAPMALRRIIVCGLGRGPALALGRLTQLVTAAVAAAHGAGGRRLVAALPALGPTATADEERALQQMFVAAVAPLADAASGALLTVYA